MTKIVVAHHEDARGTVKAYIIGFGLSVVLTLLAYFSVTQQWLTGWGLVLLLAGLAVVQLFVQLVFFLHLGRESKPRWNLTVLVFAAGVVLIIVFGSLWIMRNLEYDSGPSASPEEIIKNEGYKP